MAATGEMARRVRDKDWSETPLGRPDTWSRSLRLAVDMILSSGFPMAVRWGPDLIMIYNDAYAPILADKHPRALGLPLREVWPEIYDELGPLSEAILRGERGGFFEKDHLWRIQRHAGAWEDARFTISYSPIPDDTAPNRIGGVLTTVVETTDRVESEERLQRHSLNLEREVEKRILERDRIWELSEDLLGVSNFEGYFTSINPAWTRLLGWSEDEIKRMHVSELRHPDDAAAAVEQRARLAQGVPTVRMENRFRHKDGSWRWLAWTLSVEKDVIYVIGRHVTAEKAAVNRLRESERMFRLLVGGVTDYALFRLDPQGIISSWNAGAERITGYSASEIVGKPYSTFHTPEDRNAGLPEHALQVARSEGRYEAEGSRVRKDGSRFWANAIIDAIHDEAGALIGFAKITRDITERREAQIALAHVQEQLAQSQKMEAVGQLTGGIAHDFNNLLTIVLGNLEAAQRALGKLEPSGVGRLNRFVANAVRGAQRATTLTQRLLAFSRRQPLNPRAVDVNKFIVDAAEFLQRSLGETVEVEAVGGAGVWRAEVDADQLETSLLNLALNARDAMPAGGKLTIETSNAFLDEAYCQGQPELKPGQYVLISVSDTGTGMDPEVKARAFEPFFTTKGVGQGTGLGLSQVYGFVKQSRGHIKIYSEAGEGTTIKLYLPRAVQPSDDGAETSTAIEGLTGESGETVLLVEDDADVREYLMEVLEDLNYRVLAVQDSAGALRYLREKDVRVDVLLTDVILPGVNGRQLADQAQQIRPGLLVLFMTGYSRNAIVHHGRLDPGILVVQKPIRPLEIAARLRELLEK
jgi:PAS domain S-box-containing protein